MSLLNLDIERLAKDMVTQDNLSTQYPMWVVMESEKKYVDYSWDWDEKERDIFDGMNDEAFQKTLCDDCKALFEKDEDYDDIPEICELDMCDYDSYRYFVMDDLVPNLNPGMFLTQKACQEHINENSYHYDNPRTYAYSAWRNDDMIGLMQYVIKAGKQELPSWYS